MNSSNSQTEENKTDAIKWLKKWMTLMMISAAILVVISIVGLTLGWYDITTFIAFILPAIIVIEILFYRAISFWYQKFKYDSTSDIDDNSNPYRKVFFSGVNVLGIILLLIGFASSFFIITGGERGAVFKAAGLMIMIVWSVIFLRYFVWALYYYNINYGITDKDWAKIFTAKKDKLAGLKIIEGSDQGPSQNPYRDETFGLPPGTVRGMIAFTLLFGAIGLTVVSMGLEFELDPNSILWDNFEFFKTAFLMMIAFYFGDSSLRYLSNRWNPKSNKPNTLSSPANDASPSITPEKDIATPNTAGSPQQLRNIIESSPSATVANLSLNEQQATPEEYPQIADNEMDKVLGEDDYQKATDTLMDMGYEVQAAVLKAIVEVESSGSGFLNDGRAKILFEGHKFWHWLKEFGKKPEELISGNEDILYEKWTRQYYRGGAGEYDRLSKAMNIDRKAAIYSASWGKFQILGENLEHYIKSRIYDESDENHQKAPKLYYTDVNDFYQKQNESEYYHLLDFIAFITTKTANNNDGISVPLISFLTGNDPSTFDWGKFAYGYNGKGYKENNYDTRLKRAYERFA